MRKELLVVLCAMMFVFSGVVAVSAGTVGWTLIETANMAGHSPGSDNLLGTAQDGTGDNCNFSATTDCATNGNPTTGTYSFSKLNFVQSSSCALSNEGKAGELCTQNSDCGSLGVCVDCNTAGGGVAYAYFAKNPNGGSKGLGTLTWSACDGGFKYSNISIGTSEVLSHAGGGCMTLTPGSGTANSGCGVGAVNSTFDLDLYTSTIGTCGFPAGTMPGLALSGSIIDAGTGATAAVCGYSTSEIGGIISDAGLGTGQYLMIICGSGQLPTGLQSACLSGASYQAIMVAKTSTDLATSCADACSSGGCMAGTAEGVE